MGQIELIRVIRFHVARFYSLLVKVYGGAYGKEGLLHALKHSRLAGICSVGLGLARVLVVDCYRLSLFGLSICHMILPRRLSLKIIAVCLFVNCGGAFIPWGLFGVSESAPGGFICPDRTMTQLRSGDPFPGSYIRCEDYDNFYQLIWDHKFADAERMTRRF